MDSILFCVMEDKNSKDCKECRLCTSIICTLPDSLVLVVLIQSWKLNLCRPVLPKASGRCAREALQPQMCIFCFSTCRAYLRMGCLLSFALHSLCKRHTIASSCPGDSSGSRGSTSRLPLMVSATGSCSRTAASQRSECPSFLSLHEHLCQLVVTSSPLIPFQYLFPQNILIADITVRARQCPVPLHLFTN